MYYIYTKLEYKMNEVYIDHEQLPSVYDFLDVRVYLRSYREERKKFDHGFSNTYICYVLGQKNSKGYFNNVINGRVKIGPTILERFIALLRLNSDEAAYFRVLTNYSQASDQDERKWLLRELIGKNRKSCVEVTAQALPYYQHWHYAVIRALLDIVDCDGINLNDLAKHLLLKISNKELKKSIDLLKNIGLITRNSKGYLKPSDPIITSSEDIQRELLLQYQAMQFGHSQKVMTNSQIRPQKATTMTLSISEDTYNEIKQRISTLKSEIRSMAKHEQGPVERLFQLNMHLFPHSSEL